VIRPWRTMSGVRGKSRRPPEQVHRFAAAFEHHIQRHKSPLIGANAIDRSGSQNVRAQPGRSAHCERGPRGPRRNAIHAFCAGESVASEATATGCKNAHGRIDLLLEWKSGGDADLD